MIKAYIKERQGEFVSYEISGHAMSGEFGHDIVCSAVSVLGITTCNSIEAMTGIPPLVELADGYLYVEIPEDLDDEQSKIAQILLKSFKLSMETVTSEYGEYISFTEKN